MKTLSVSMKHLMILAVFIMPFSFLYYQFLALQNLKIDTLRMQKVKIELVKKKAQVIDQLLSQRLTNSLNQQQRKANRVRVGVEIESFENILLDSKLVFTAHFYTYYMTQMALVQMPDLYRSLDGLVDHIESADFEVKDIKLKLAENLKQVSILSAQAISAQSSNEGKQRRQVASVRSYLDQTFHNVAQAPVPSAISIKKVLLSEVNSLSTFWLQSLNEIGKDISFRYEAEKTERMKYSVIMFLIVLGAIACTMSIFFDMSQRIKRLTHLTRYTDPRQLSIQTTDFGYDEIGQLAQSFNTMALTLKDSFEKIEAANSAKSIFLANVSHELRTPISGIIGMTQFMSETSLTNEQAGFLKIIKKSSDMLLILINDLLDLAKIESGKMTLESIPFSLPDLLQDVYDCFRHQAEQKGLRLVLTFPTEQLCMYVGDPYKIKQIIFNLVSNALKFTSAGQVEIMCEVISGQRSAIRIVVKDEGIGIPDDKLASLFQDFVQVDASTKRKFGGTGLGLSLSKKLARLMSGELSVASELGHGTQFTLDIHLEKAGERIRNVETDQSELDKVPRSSASFCPRILVAEDNAVNQLIVKKYLQKWNYEATFVENGRQAVEQAQTSQFDVILMDCQMPEMDGFEATKIIKLKLPQAYIIALTANATEEDKQRCRDAGMDDFITKPIDPERLMSLIMVAAPPKAVSA